MTSMSVHAEDQRAQPEFRLSLDPLVLPLHQTPSGVIRFTGTRISLDLVIDAFRDGATPEALVLGYPTLSLPSVYAVLAYYLQHQEAVDAYMARRADHRAAVQAAVEQRFDPSGIRARLLARQQPC